MLVCAGVVCVGMHMCVHEEAGGWHGVSPFPALPYFETVSLTDRAHWLVTPTGQRAPGGLQSLLPMLRSQACATVPAFSMAAAAAVHQAPHPISHLLCPRHIFNQENSSYKWAEPDFLPIFRPCQSWCETNKREDDETTNTKHRLDFQKWLPYYLLKYSGLSNCMSLNWSGCARS